MCILWQYMPHPALGVFHISLVAGNNMDMDMKYALTRGGANIHSDIVAIRAKLTVYQLLFPLDKVHTGNHFLGGQLKKAGDMSSGYDHRMSRADRIAVPGAVGELIFQRYPFSVCAKKAWIIGVSFTLRRQANTPFKSTI